MSAKDDTQRILNNAAEIARIAEEIRSGRYADDEREPDDEPPTRPESEAEDWDRNTASNEAFLNRERHR